MSIATNPLVGGIQRRVTLAITIFGLIILRGLLGYAATAAQSLEADPLIPITLSGLAWLVSAIIIGLVLLLCWHWLRKGWDLLASMLFEAFRPEPEARPAVEDPFANTQSLGQAVASLQRNGQFSREALETAEVQARSLVEVVKRLQQTASDMGRQVASLETARTALQEGDVLAIRETSGGIRDEHIASLMQLASEDTDATYWQSVLEMVAIQLGSCRRWQQDYSVMTARLMAETTAIKQGLLEAEARITLSEAAHPLLTARANVERVVSLLRPPALSQAQALEARR